MPLFEYRCQACDMEFEALVRAADEPSCPACGASNLERLLTTFAVNSAERSKRALTTAREAYRRSRDRSDRLRHEAEEIRDHLQQDYGVDTTAKEKP
jgi:putative FmdB family regulatory protein